VGAAHVVISNLNGATWQSLEAQLQKAWQGDRGSISGDRSARPVNEG
jgi:hypothetical protein